MSNISDIAAIRKWNSIPEDIYGKIIAERILWKLRCNNNSSRVYDNRKEGLGILLSGKCTKCGHVLCRVIEE
jgi:hypothetical protein